MTTTRRDYSGHRLGELSPAIDLTADEAAELNEIMGAPSSTRALSKRQQDQVAAFMERVRARRGMTTHGDQEHGMSENKFRNPHYRRAYLWARADIAYHRSGQLEPRVREMMVADIVRLDGLEVDHFARASDTYTAGMFLGAVRRDNRRRGVADDPLIQHDGGQAPIGNTPTDVVDGVRVLQRLTPEEYRVVNALLTSGNPEDYQEAIEMMNRAVDRMPAGTDVTPGSTGAPSLRVGNTPGQGTAQGPAMNYLSPGRVGSAAIGSPPPQRDPGRAPFNGAAPGGLPPPPRRDARGRFSRMPSPEREIASRMAMASRSGMDWEPDENETLDHHDARERAPRRPTAQYGGNRMPSADREAAAAIAARNRSGMDPVVERPVDNDDESGGDE